MSNLQSKAEEWFKTLHRHPELGFEEFETTALIRRVLTDNGIELLPWPLQTGALAVIRGGKSGPVIALRADIDALPVQEDSGLRYASEIPGRMHACGHDFHTAMLLAVAILLQERREELAGTVKLVFQPNEEHAAGAREVEKTGVLSDVSLLLAGHTYTAEAAGWLGIKAGPAMAAVDSFSVTLKGLSAHAASPHLSVDPVPAICELTLALQTLISRRVDPFANALLTVAHVQAGNTWNVIPETAMLEGTVRTTDKETRTLIRQSFRQVTEGIAAAHGLQPEIEWIEGPPAVINDEHLAAEAAVLAQELGFRVGPPENTMGGEDFSFLAPDKPRLFVRVGTGGSRPAHHPGFTADPAALYPAAGFFAELAARLLKNN